MPSNPRPRRLVTAALTVALLVLAAACAQSYPNSVFHNRTDFNRDVTWLFYLIIGIGTVVFVFVEGLLIWTIFRYRAKPGSPTPEHVHGNTTLEITWTAIPALILLGIAIPTVKTIFRTEGTRPAGALHVRVVGHQWWWEFDYPEYKIITANELYLPIGRTVEFELQSADVIHSFWVPALGGKRDVVSNHTNYLWFTPDSSGSNTWNGVCAEYCGTSHANMRFRAFTVSQADFDSWVKNQQSDAAMLPPAPAPPTPAAGAPGQPATTTAAKPATKPGKDSAAGAAAPAGMVANPVVQSGFIRYPDDKIPDYARPNTAIPVGLTFDESLKGDPANGAKLMMGAGTCNGCHFIQGNPMMVGQIGPNLTHVASRSTIAGALFPNTPKYLELWIKNARLMKPGATMSTLGAGQFDPAMGKNLPAGMGISDQQIADIVAYLQLLK